MMTNLPKYYTLLFGAVEDALDDLDAHNYGAARDRLVTGHRRRRKPISRWGKAIDQQMTFSL